MVLDGKMVQYLEQFVDKFSIVHFTKGFNYDTTSILYDLLKTLINYYHKNEQPWEAYRITVQMLKRCSYDYYKYAHLIHGEVAKTCRLSFDKIIEKHPEIADSDEFRMCEKFMESGNRSEIEKLIYDDTDEDDTESDEEIYEDHDCYNDRFADFESPFAKYNQNNRIDNRRIIFLTDIIFTSRESLNKTKNYFKKYVTIVNISGSNYQMIIWFNTLEELLDGKKYIETLCDNTIIFSTSQTIKKTQYKDIPNFISNKTKVIFENDMDGLLYIVSNDEKYIRWTIREIEKYLILSENAKKELCGEYKKMSQLSDKYYQEIIEFLPLMKQINLSTKN